MPVANYPWRIVVVAAISLIGNSYLGYYLLFGLRADGVDLGDRGGRVMVTEVYEDGPAAQAGMRAGDQILSVNGQRIGTAADWLAQRMNFAPAQPVAIAVRRGDQTPELTMVIRGRLWDELRASARASQAIFL